MGIINISTFFTAVDSCIATIAIAGVVIDVVDANTMVLTGRSSKIVNYAFILSCI